MSLYHPVPTRFYKGASIFCRHTGVFVTVIQEVGKWIPAKIPPG